LLVVRHAEAGANAAGTVNGEPPGPGLTAAGRAQAATLGRELADERVDLGVATRFLRTQETLAAALGDRDVPRAVLSAFDEIRYGAFEGGPLEAYRGWAWTEPPDVRPPGGGESRADVAARVAGGMDALLGRDEEVILLVGHALPLRYVVDAADGSFPAARVEQLGHAVAGLRLDADAVATAAQTLRAWSREPRFRDAPA
jgi:probable phosphoglycerate mutase